MSIFDIFKKKNNNQDKWNKMWDMWASNQAKSPYKELMTYESEINNGGHLQFFDNLINNNEFEETYTILENILPTNLKNNLINAFEAYKINDEDALDEYDNIFYENEKEIENLLWKYANKINL